MEVVLAVVEVVGGRFCEDCSGCGGVVVMVDKVVAVGEMVVVNVVGRIWRRWS